MLPGTLSFRLEGLNFLGGFLPFYFLGGLNSVAALKSEKRSREGLWGGEKSILMWCAVRVWEMGLAPGHEHSSVTLMGLDGLRHSLG